MPRVHEWRENLHNLVIKLHTTPLHWGYTDCWLGLGGPNILAMTGKDYFSDFLGTYDSPIGALRMLKSKGFNSLEEMLKSQFKEIHVSQAWVGDEVIMDGEETGGAIGVVLGERIGVMTLTGYGTIDRMPINAKGEIVQMKAFRIE